MTQVGEWQVPPSLLRLLVEAPQDAAVAVLLRHSVRPPLPPGDAGLDVPITAEGAVLARRLGAILGTRLRTVHTSPVARCVQTAEAIRDGAAAVVAIRPDRLLGHPGVYVVDGRAAGPSWARLGHEGMMAHIVAGKEPLPGMARPDEAARFLIRRMLGVGGAERGIHVFVTHDSLVTATVARFLGRPLGPDAWPWYLEGACFWREGAEVHAAYRELRGTADWDGLCGFADLDVAEFARREVAMTVGLDCDARYFLAGGAFKTLLTGGPPRDLDLWAASDADREVLIGALRRRGASLLDPLPFADAFAIADRIVEVPRETRAPTLEQRLGRMDIALSAIGVEFGPLGWGSVFVHPLALESARRREVLLLKPLANWKYALVTLERMRRYAAELGYVVPPSEEEAVWRVFERQPPEMQRGMLERFDRAARGDQGVREEVASRACPTCEAEGGSLDVSAESTENGV